MKVSNLNNSGFTLIELLLVIALLSITVGVTSDILVNLIRSYNKTHAMNNVEQTANFVSMKLTKELRNASGVITPPTTGTSGPTLVFSDRNNNQVQYSVSGNAVVRCILVSGACQAGTSFPLNITGATYTDAVNATCPVNPCFTRRSSDPDAVDINIIFDQANTGGNPQFTSRVNIKTTVIVRNTY